MRIGVIGTGLIAHTNVEAILALGRAEIAALCNRTEEKGRAFGAKYAPNAPVYTDYRQMLDAGKLDAVLINTPHGQHEAQFVACAERGLNILIEKPLGTTAGECQRMIEARDRFGVGAVVCHTQRYLPPLRLARLLMGEQAAALGKLRHITDRVNLHYFQERRAAWFFDPALAGGGLRLTHGSHQIDRVHFLCGHSSRQVFARFEELPAYPGLDSGYQLLGTAGDVSYTVSCAGYSVPHASDIQLDFEGGSLRVALFSNGAEEAGVWLGGPEGYKPMENPFQADDPYKQQFSALLDALEGKPSDAPTLEEAAAVLGTLDAALRSHQTGRAEAV